MNHKAQHTSPVKPPKAKLVLLAQAGVDLHILISGLCRQVMYRDTTPEQANNNKFNIGHWYIVSQQIKDLLMNLKQIDMHATHGLNGTIPEDYDPLDDENEEAYNPYSEMLYAFDTDSCIPVDTLPEELKELLDGLPGASRAQSEAFDQFFGDSLTMYDPQTKESIKPTIEQRAASIDQQYVEALELSFVANTYEADLKQIKQLIETRAPFEIILKVLHNW